MKKLLRWSVTILVMILVIEVLLRVFGMTPHDPAASSVIVTPSHYGVPHPTLGFGLKPGEFHIQKAESLKFTVTHKADSFRRTSQNPKAKNLGDVNFYGCSITYGFGVDDDEAYAWKVQEELPEYRINNYGVSGYGLAQFYLLLEQHLQKKDLPSAVVLGYAGFQDERGTMMCNWKKSLAPAMKEDGFEDISLFPYINDESGGFTVDYCPAQYVEWPLMRSSAFMHALESAYNFCENNIVDSHKVSWEVVQAMADLCAAKNVHFILVGLDTEEFTQSMINYCAENEIEAHGIGEDLSRVENTYLPIDPHPRPSVHVIYAERLLPILRKALE
jgi:hypothetical protein